MRRALVALLLVLAPAPLAAQRLTADWPPADRAVLGDFGRVLGIASTPFRTWVAAPAGVALWLPAERRWEGPWDVPERGLLDGVFQALADPLDESLWLATRDGWIHFQPELRGWERGFAPGTVRTLAVDQDDPAGGVLLQTSSGWYRLLPGSGAPLPAPAPRRPRRPASVEDAFRALPALQAFSAGVLQDARGRPVRYSVAAPGGDGLGWYLGTTGLGLFFARPGDARPEPVPFGLRSPRLGAVLSVPGGVWAAGERTTIDDEVLTLVRDDLAPGQVVGGSRALGLGYRQVRRMAGRGRELWLATDQGLLRVEPEAERVERWTLGRGLPDDRVYDVVARRGTVYAATARGAAALNDSLEVTRLAPDLIDPILAIEAGADTVWLGTAAGVRYVVPDGPPMLPAQLADEPALRASVIDLAWLADTLVALTDDALVWREPGGRWRIGPLLSASLGRLRVMTVTPAGLVVAGDEGFGFVRLGEPPVRVWREDELPAVVRDLAADDTYLWMATEAGLVRWRLEAIRP